MNDISIDVYANSASMDSLIQTLRNSGVDTTEMQAALADAQEKTSKSALVETYEILKKTSQNMLKCQEKAAIFTKKYKSFIINQSAVNDADDDLIKEKIKQRVGLVFRDVVI